MRRHRFNAVNAFPIFICVMANRLTKQATTSLIHSLQQQLQHAITLEVVPEQLHTGLYQAAEALRLLAMDAKDMALKGKATEIGEHIAAKQYTEGLLLARGH